MTRPKYPHGSRVKITDGSRTGELGTVHDPPSFPGVPFTMQNIGLTPVVMDSGEKLLISNCRLEPFTIN